LSNFKSDFNFDSFKFQTLVIIPLILTPSSAGFNAQRIIPGVVASINE